MNSQRNALFRLAPVVRQQQLGLTQVFFLKQRKHSMTLPVTPKASKVSMINSTPAFEKPAAAATISSTSSTRDDLRTTKKRKPSYMSSAYFEDENKFFGNF
eukprot:Awhi_evm1s951